MPTSIVDPPRAQRRTRSARHARAAHALPCELSGPPDAPLVVVLGGISATRHVASTPDDPTPGWWEAVVGPRRGIDTTRFRVAGVEVADGGRAADGRPAREVTTRDQADALAATLDAIGVARAHAVVGASYGGMVALAFGAAHADRAERLVVIGAAHESHPYSTGLRALQRRVVELGLAHGCVRDAMALARGVAMTTYRTADELARRFASPSARSTLDAVDGYLHGRGRAWAASCPPERFLALSLSADLHRVAPEDVRVPAVLVAADGDLLVPGAQVRALAARLGAPCTLARLASDTGHDAFLTEPAQVSRLVAAALDVDVAACTDALIDTITDALENGDLAA